MHMGRFDEAEAVLLEALKKVTVTCPNFCFAFQIHFPLAPQKTMQHIHIKWCQKNGKIEVINWLLAIFIFVCIVRHSSQFLFAERATYGQGNKGQKTPMDATHVLRMIFDTSQGGYNPRFRAIVSTRANFQGYVYKYKQGFPGGAGDKQSFPFTGIFEVINMAYPK